MVKSKEELKGRGNNIVIGNDNGFQMIWAPVFEATEFFARHWALLSYCFETGMISSSEPGADSKHSRMWGTGEPMQRSDGSVCINEYSGSFSSHVSNHVLQRGVSAKDHYSQLARVLSDQFDTPFVFIEIDFMLDCDSTFANLDIQCDIVPESYVDFDSNKCYRYNVFPGVLKFFQCTTFL